MREGGKVARRPEGRKEAAAAMDFGGKVAGAGGLGTSGHGFPSYEHQEKEETQVNSFPAAALPGRGPSGMLHGRWPWSLSEHEERGPESHETTQGKH